MSKRHSAPLALAMIDIDRFKNVNDTYGHQAGDAVIVAISRMISSRLRKEDIFARFGGDEFAILLPGTGIDTARDLCELFRQQVAENPVALPDGQSCPVTLSIGIAERASGTGSLIELNAAADKALYLSKEMGRNRVSRYPMEQE